MTTEDKIKVLAELDGRWSIQFPYQPEGHQAFEQIKYLPCYLTSYDAIIPLIQKQPKEIRLKMFEEKADRVSIMTTPEQLADALIKAVGKWKE